MSNQGCGLGVSVLRPSGDILTFHLGLVSTKTVNVLVSEDWRIGLHHLNLVPKLQATLIKNVNSTITIDGNVYQNTLPTDTVKLKHTICVSLSNSDITIRHVICQITRAICEYYYRKDRIPDVIRSAYNNYKNDATKFTATCRTCRATVSERLVQHQDLFAIYQPLHIRHRESSK